MLQEFTTRANVKIICVGLFRHPSNMNVKSSRYLEAITEKCSQAYFRTLVAGVMGEYTRSPAKMRLQKQVLEIAELRSRTFLIYTH